MFDEDLDEIDDNVLRLVSKATKMKTDRKEAEYKFKGLHSNYRSRKAPTPLERDRVRMGLSKLRTGQDGP